MSLVHQTDGRMRIFTLIILEKLFGVYDGIFVKPEHIKVESVFALDKVNIEEFLK